MKRTLALVFAVLALSGCSLFRANPLAANRGAVVLILDLRTAGDPKPLCETLADHGACATFFAAGQVSRDTAVRLDRLLYDGHRIGVSGLKGVRAQTYCQMYGLQKYFQDEYVTQILGARRYGLDPRYALVGPLEQQKPTPMELTSFLVGKGFSRVVHRMPDYVPLRAVPPSGLTESVIHAYPLTEKNFDRAQVAALAKRNEVMVVCADKGVLPALLRAAREEGVPCVTIADLPNRR